MQAELSEVLKDAVITIFVMFAGYVLEFVRKYYIAGRVYSLAHIDTIKDTTVRLAIKDAVLAVEQMALSYLKNQEEKWTSQEKLEEAAEILKNKGVPFTLADIEATVRQLKAKGDI